MVTVHWLVSMEPSPLALGCWFSGAWSLRGAKSFWLVCTVLKRIVFDNFGQDFIFDEGMEFLCVHSGNTSIGSANPWLPVRVDLIKSGKILSRSSSWWG